MKRPIAILVVAIQCSVLGVASASAHGGDVEQLRTRILSVEPAGLPVDVRIVDGDQVRFENAGDEPLVICGYEQDAGGECEPWVRIDADGVFVDTNARSYYANVDELDYGSIPEDAGTKPAFERVRERPAFYAYHDHRVHWMGASLPPSVDESDPDPQRVFDAEIAFRYGEVDGVVKTRLEYVGGQTWLRRYGERFVVAMGIVAMLGVFTVDAMRRRRARRVAGNHVRDPGGT